MAVFGNHLELFTRKGVGMARVIPILFTPVPRVGLHDCAVASYRCEDCRKGLNINISMPLDRRRQAGLPFRDGISAWNCSGNFTQNLAITEAPLRHADSRPGC